MQRYNEQDYNEVVTVIAKTVIDAVKRIVSNLSFDKTTFGIILKANGTEYTVSAFGKEYVIISQKTFSVGQRVAVTAPQSDFKHLIMHDI